MSKIKRLIPFRFLPASFGLKGIAYEQAEACYYYEGEDLERTLVNINFKNDIKNCALEHKKLDLKYNYISQYDFDLCKLKYDGKDDIKNILDLKLQYKIISQDEYDNELIEITLPEGIDKEIAKLNLQLKNGIITQKQFEKECATLKNEPYITIIDDGFDLNLGINGVYFEFDWNDLWIDYLKLNGYDGDSDEAIVQSWFSSVCKQVVQDDLNGTNYS